MLALAGQHHGILRPENVVAFAKDEASALHSKFEWNNTKAGHEYRLWQARELIAVVKVRIPETNGEYRAFVSLQADREKKGGGYRSLVTVLSEKNRRQQFLQEALAEFDRWQQKYESLVELAEIFKARHKVK